MILTDNIVKIYSEKTRNREREMIKWECMSILKV